MTGKEIHHFVEKDPYPPASARVTFLSLGTGNLWALLGLGPTALKIGASSYGNRLDHMRRSDMPTQPSASGCPTFRTAYQTMGTKCGLIQVPALPHTVGRGASLVGIMEAAVSSNHTANEPFSPDDQTAGNSFRLISRRSKATVLPPSRGGHLICQPYIFTPTSEVCSLSLSPGTVSCGSWEGKCHGQLLLCSCPTRAAASLLPEVARSPPPGGQVPWVFPDVDSCASSR